MKIKSLIKNVLVHGKRYESKLASAELPRGKTHDCFDHSLIVAMMNPNLRYVEGVAKFPNGKWAVHAWLTDGTHAFDLTWRIVSDEGKEYPFKTEYIGIEMDTEKVAEFCRITEYKSVLFNGWRDKKRAKELLGFAV